MNISAEQQRRHEEIYGKSYPPPFEFEQIAPHLWAGRNPLSAPDIEQLMAAGVTHILDLRQESEWTAPRFGAEALDWINQRGLTRVHCKILDMGAPDDAALDQACAFLRAIEQDNSGVYVHCRAGMERTAAVLIAWIATSENLDYDTALQRARSKRAILAPLPGQERAVRRWLAAKSKTHGK